MVWAYVRAVERGGRHRGRPDPASRSSPGANLDYPNQNEAIAPSTGTPASPPAWRVSSRWSGSATSSRATTRPARWWPGTPPAPAPTSCSTVASAADGAPAPRGGGAGRGGPPGLLRLPARRGRDAGGRVDPGDARSPTPTTGIDLAPAGGLHPDLRLGPPLRGPRAPTTRPTSGRSGSPSWCAPPTWTPTWETRTSRPPATGPPSPPGDPGYRRTVFETSVAIPNMESRAPFFPAIVPTTDASAGVLNVGGG